MALHLQPQILSDKRKLIALLSLLLSLGFIMTSLASYFASKASIRASIIVNELPLTSDNIYSEIQKDLVRPIFISSMMASDTFLRDWALKGERNTDEIGKYLKEVKDRYSVFTSFYISEQSRIYYHAAGILKTVKESDAHDIWYFRVRGMKEPYEISVDTDQANRNALTIFINHRVFDYDGRFIGVAGVGLTVDAVRKLINEYQQRYGRNIYFVDPKGNVILYANNSGDAGKNIRHMPGLDSVADAILKTQSGSFQYKLDSREHLLNVRLIRELNWYIFVEKTEDEALFEIRRTLFINLGICLLITGVVLFITNLAINRYQSRLETMATSDKLTGLANRQAFEVIAEHAIKQANRSGEPLSALLIDIDLFKHINDIHGHLVGDSVIQGVAGAAKVSLRDSDILCRWGGEEYLVLLKGCDMANALALAEKLRQAVKEAEFRHGTTLIPVTVSVGVAEYQNGEVVDQLLHRADTALYAAKEGGRDCVCQA